MHHKEQSQSYQAKDPTIDGERSQATLLKIFRQELGAQKSCHA
jgi:hypothetical protein